MTAAKAAVSEMLRETLKAVDNHQVLIPITRAVLMDPSFKGFDVAVEGWTPRPYDGKFHPSSHATWTARQLYFYLARPDLYRPEQMSITSIFAITQGKFWHQFLQQLWLTHGILQLDEIPVNCPEYNITGHADGLLSIWTEGNFEGLEIKTMNDFKLPKVTNAEELRALYPEYYAQTQDYLMALGLKWMRYFIIGMSTPYPMSEFLVEADPEFQAAQQRKYRLALDRFAQGTPPPACCGIGSAEAKACPMKNACEIGRLS